jgi:subtilisin family serine protease
MIAMKAQLASLLVTSALALLATGCGGSSGGASLTAVAVGPGSISVRTGASQQLTATGTWSDGSSSNLAAQATWTSSNPVVASVSSTGVLTGHAPGTVAVVAASAGVVGMANATVVAPTLDAISISPAAISSAKGTTLQIHATGTWSDGSTSDLTSQATWNSSDATVASISSSGLLTAHVLGTASVTAVSAGVTGTAPATVTAAELTAVAVTPEAVVLPRWGAQQFLAMATYGDGTTADVTRQVAWASSATGNVTVTSSGLAAISGSAATSETATVTATLSGRSGGSTVSVSTPTLTILAVTPRSDDIVAGGGALQFTATAYWSDESSEDVTGRATWTSTAPEVVAIDASARANAAAGGRVGTQVPILAAFAGLERASALRVVRGPPLNPARTADPLAGQEWYLLNVGQKAFADVAGTPGVDLNLLNAFSMGLSGKGVKVAIIDSGLEIKHEDLEANVVPGSWNFLTGTDDPTPTPEEAEGPHGTSVAGIVAMVHDNSVGGMGVAPRSSLNGYNWLAKGAGTSLNFIKSIGGSSAKPMSDAMSIFNLSVQWSNTGPMTLESAVEEQYWYSVTSLRGGLGAIHVKCAGNGFEDHFKLACAEANGIGVTCQNASYDSRNVLPYNIVVGALNALGIRSSYSTAGSALWVSAPGGEYGKNRSVAPGKPENDYEAAMVTTDLSGCTLGYAWTDADDSTFNRGGSNNPSCSYTNTFNGTSSAAPSTAGAIALLLDARPDLGWRDVKHILASTATKVDLSRDAVIDTSLAGGDYVAELPWIINAAGYSFHDWYGFGAVDVDAAVEMARTYEVGFLRKLVVSEWWGQEKLTMVIPDADSNGVTSTIDKVWDPAIGFIEAVQVAWSATHARMSDLGIKLTSPSGTTSILLNIKGGFTTTVGPENMILLSNAFYGEDPNGVWTIEVVDGRSGVEGTLTEWSIRIFGH